jgi:hypothetical protein
MTPFECFKTYSALKLHFSSEYNYFQYNGNLRLKPESFEKRPDKVFFAKVAKHSDPLNFLMINILDDPKAWIRNIAYSPESESKYSTWLKRKQSLAYSFKEELKKLDADFDKNLRVVANGHPPLIADYLGGHVSLETVCIIATVTGCIKYWDKAMSDDPVWEETSRKIKKYTPFLNIDASKYKKIILESFGNQD